MGKQIVKKIIKNQAGQTLIETVVAVFILVMGIVAALGLAIYALNASSNVSKQIIAIGLAREGVEAVKNIRDTNWLKDSLTVNGCYDFTSNTNNAANCYTNWLSPSSCNSPNNDKGYCIDPPGGSKGYQLGYVTDTGKKFWDFNSSNNNWGLDLDTDPTSGAFVGFYIPRTNRADGNSDFYREVILTTDNTAPYNKSNLQKLLVQSQVWWTDKKCPRAATFAAAKVTCKVELKSYLTNWKNW